MSKPFIFNKISEFLPELAIKAYLEKKQILPCQAGKYLMVIWDNGDVSPCEVLNTTIGNIRDFDYDLVKAFNSLKAKKILSDIKQKKCYCTWENMILVNCLKSLRFYPKLALEIIKSIFK